MFCARLASGFVIPDDQKIRSGQKVVGFFDVVIPNGNTSSNSSSAGSYAIWKLNDFAIDYKEYGMAWNSFLELVKAKGPVDKYVWVVALVP